MGDEARVVELTDEDFRASVCAPKLSTADRLLIVKQALLLLEQNYVHLEQKREVHGVDPVQRMRRVLRSLEETPGLLDDDEFNREMINTLTTVRDRHLAYLLPACWDDYDALLPFTLQEIKENGRRLYIVDEVTGNTGDAEFVPGVEVTSWNGVAMRRAVLKSGELEAGTTEDARRAMGWDSLTSRSVVRDGLPEEDWIVVGYRNGAGDPREIRVKWKVVMVQPTEASIRVAEPDMDSRLDRRRRMQRAISPRELGKAVAAARNPYRTIPTAYGSVFEARAYGDGAKSFGYIRIRRFRRDNLSDDGFVDEFVRLLEAVPPKRLVLDIRDNPGGNIAAAERMLQTLTRRSIEPANFQFRNTRGNLDLCKEAPAGEKLGPWIASIEQGLKSGKPYSAALPKTDVGECNSIGRIYPGSSVLMTNARSYSAADFFAAGFQDHKIGPILGVHARTGGGGANVWDYAGKFTKFLPRRYPQLSAGISFAVAMRRSLRVGLNAGKLLEEAGVEVSEVQELTRNDVLADDIDIITKAALMVA